MHNEYNLTVKCDGFVEIAMHCQPQITEEKKDRLKFQEKKFM